MLEFKQEAVRLVESGQRVSEAARRLGIVEQTLKHFPYYCRDSECNPVQLFLTEKLRWHGLFAIPL